VVAGTSGEGEGKEKVLEGEQDRSTLYACMKTALRTVPKYCLEKGVGAGKVKSIIEVMNLITCWE
jgi:hypothetical protein